MYPCPYKVLVQHVVQFSNFKLKELIIALEIDMKELIIALEINMNPFYSIA